MRSAAFAIGAIALLGAGCFGSEETPFPPGLEPLEETNLASPPAGTPEDPFPEVLSMTRAMVGPRTKSVHAIGFVHRPLADVWEALRDPDVGADRRTFARWSTTADVEPEYDFSYVIHSVIEMVITVEYDVTWRHGVIEGTVEAPIFVSARYQKTDGSTVIQRLEGGVLLREVEPGITRVEIIEYLRTINGSEHDAIESFLQDMFAELVIRARGEPLPPIDELRP
ncbi:MAG: hypothetical protein AB7S26_30285 [Sandaracinaceae bacterium]